jgi:hypothetical protein
MEERAYQNFKPTSVAKIKKTNNPEIDALGA